MVSFLRAATPQLEGRMTTKVIHFKLVSRFCLIFNPRKINRITYNIQYFFRIWLLYTSKCLNASAIEQTDFSSNMAPKLPRAGDPGAMVVDWHLSSELDSPAPFYTAGSRLRSSSSCVSFVWKWSVCRMRIINDFFCLGVDDMCEWLFCTLYHVECRGRYAQIQVRKYCTKTIKPC